MKLNRVQKDILTYCSDDDMGFWVVVRYVTEDKFGHIQMLPRREQKKVLREVRKLLDLGLIEIQQYNGTEFVKIEGSVSKLMGFIDREWKKLGVMPSGGDVCWFKATPKGEALARELNLL
jgi:hypothetical protein